MAAPSLRIPLGLDMAGFEQNIGKAKSLTSTATDFMLKEFAKSQLKLAVNSSEFKPAVQGAAKFLGDQFNQVKPLIKSVTQDAVRESTAASLKVADAFAAPAIKGSFQAFAAVGIPAAQGFAAALLPIAARLGPIAIAAFLVADAIGAARRQITEMVAVADKAGNLNVSPAFLQQFEGVARGLKVTVDDLDQALAHAFSATKEKSPIDVSKWEAAGERITEIELALRVYNAELEKTTGKRLDGLVLFRDADTQDQKVRAVLAAMVELEQAGKRLEALDIGEKMFGAAFVDKIRQGKTSASEILATMDKLKASGDGVFTDAMVRRAKEVDDQLKLSEDRLSRAMKPSWDELASVILTIKGYWADVVELMAKAVEFANKIGGTSLEQLQSQLKEVNDRLAGNATGAIGWFDSVMKGINVTRGKPGGGDLPDFIRSNLEKSRDDLQQEIARRTAYQEQYGPPAPTRGTGGAPTLIKKPKEEERDRFDAATDAAAKRVAGLEAEANAIDMTAAARARAKIAAELETVAKQANAAAGLGANVVTDEQRAKIDALADAYARATEKIEQSRTPMATFIRESADLSKQLNQFGADAFSSTTDSLVGVVTGTKKVGDAFKSMANSIIADLARIAIQKSITGPLANAMGGLFGGGTNLFSGLFSSASNATDGIGGYGPTVPGYASGTDYHPGGMAIVGENGPELLNLPRGAQVVPNDVARLSSGGGVVINNYTDASVQAQQTPGGGTVIDLRRMVDDAVGQSLSTGSGRRVLQKQFGVSQFMGA
ncbi:phage tail tape measure C-terminal domain-containing protein [Rhodopseudomonas telluris]|uniref:Phage tail tape measure C-terminal domain-containing protein n=1 Tax=Rhodopseudomonas telluris TaxID=644215 RepID=A0ABV6EZL9_9BRAD